MCKCLIFAIGKSNAPDYLAKPTEAKSFAPYYLLLNHNQL